MADQTNQNGNNFASSTIIPRIYQSDANKKFLTATLDQLMQSGTAKKINGFIGRENAKASTGKDVYVAAVDQTRQNYQLEPGLVIKDTLGNVTFLKDYQDYINQLTVFGSNTSNHARLNKQEMYSWDPHIDWDKFVNFQNYYWLPYGPDVVKISGQQKNIVSTYTVNLVDEGGNYQYVFTPDGLTPNPTITLYKGQTYKFEVNSPGNPFAIKTSRTAGNLDFYNESELITNNGVEVGTLTFSVPEDAPSQLYYLSNNDANAGGLILVLPITDNSSLDVEKDILGKKNYTLPSGISLSNGMKVAFEGTITPSNYSSGTYYVEGVGTSISLVSSDLLEIIKPFTAADPVPFDSGGFDTQPFSDATSYAGTNDYIVINRSSRDQNPWSRFNRWFHKDVITLAAEANGDIPNLDQASRAIRPIIEFEPNIRLYNFGTKALADVDLIDTTTTDVFSYVEGKLGYYIDGIAVANGQRILFTADTDLFVKNKIFQVNYLNIEGSNQIHLTLVDTPLEDNCVLVKQGVSNQGQTYWFDGSVWILAQQKNTVNQQPLFDIVDKNKIKFSDITTYTGSTFAGTKLFSYAVSSTGTTDSALGFPIKYKNIDNIGDIVFNFNLAQDSFTYKLNNTIVSKNVDTGYLIRTSLDGSAEYINGWQITSIPVTQAAIRIYKNSGLVNNFIIDIFDDVNNLDDLIVKIYINGTRLGSENWTIASGTTFKTVVLNTDILTTDVLTIRAFSAQPINDKGYYEIPLNLQNNPLNSNIDTFTLGEVIDHVGSIVDNISGFVGVFPGTSNLRDIANLSTYGTKFVQHSGPLSLGLYHVTNQDTNIIKAIEKSQNDYNIFKRNFITVAENIGIDTDTISLVDLILGKINSTKSNTGPYYFSDMVPYGASIKTDITVLDGRTKTYPLSAVFNLDSLSSKSVLIYQNKNQLIHGRDYTFDNQGFVIITDSVNLQAGDIISIFEYENTDGSFVPETPTKLGIWPAYEPKLYLDTSLINPVMVIQGHDGSQILAYGDYRDNLILELEKRIFNNIKVKYDPTIFDIHDLIPGYTRNTDYTLDEFNEILAPYFYKWATLVDKDFTTPLSFDRNNPLTFNYKGHYAPDGRPVPGYWRGIYRWLFDTDRPNLCPWEMLGFTIEPVWWNSVYGPAPYTSDNLVLWQDIANGVVRDPSAAPYVITKFIRPWLIKHIPVDSQGNILSPYDAGVAQGTITYDTAGDYIFGDVSPVEAAWRRGSYYPFAVLLASLLLQPAKTIGTLLDRSRIVRNLSGQLVYSDTDNRINPGSIELPGLYNSISTTRTAGIINYAINYVLGDSVIKYNSYAYDLSNINTNLTYRIGAFTSKDQFNIILDSRTPLSTSSSVFVPQENYDIVLNSSSPITKINYSGVIVTKLTDGYTVSGYILTNPYFEYYDYQGTGISVNVGGVSHSYLVWHPKQTYAPGNIIQYNGQYYSVLSLHTTIEIFQSQYYSVLGALPVTGGVNAYFKNTWDKSKVIKVPYGTKYSHIQDVVDFLLGYGEYLKDQGFIFDEYNNNLNAISNWETSTKEFMFWTTQNWSTGIDKWQEWSPTQTINYNSIVRYDGDYYQALQTIQPGDATPNTNSHYIKLDGLSTVGSSVISLSPAANKITFNVPLAVVDDITNQFNGYGIYKVDGTEFDFQSLSSFRNGNIVTYTPDNNDGIYGATFYLIQQEQIVIIDNSTMFGDIIYNPETGYRQERLKISSYVTVGWYGGFDVPGFIIDRAQIKNWESYQDYSLGDIVLYQQFYYTANKFLSGSQSFEVTASNGSANWIRLKSKPQPKLIPNWTYKATQFTDFYSLGGDNFDTNQRSVAQHLIGYQKRQYLNDIIQDDVSEFKFYQGMIYEKGTQNVLNKLFDVLSSDNLESLNFYEEWAVRVGQYGSSNAFNEIEFILDESKFITTPQGFELLPSVTQSYKDFIIRLSPKDIYLPPSSYDSNPWPLITNYQSFLRSAGYARLDEVAVTLNSLSDITSQNINNFNEGDYVWCGFENISWNIYRLVRTNIRVSNILYSNSVLTISTTKDLGSIVAGSYIGLKETGIVDINGTYVNSFDGFYQVSSVTNSTMTINVSLPKQPSNPFTGQADIVLFTFLSHRASSIDVLDQVVTPDLKSGELAWTDDNGNGLWSTWQNNPVYDAFEVASPSTSTGLGFGSSVAISQQGNILATTSNSGELIIYTKINSNAPWQIKQGIFIPSGLIAPYTLALSPDSIWLAVGVPSAANGQGTVLLYEQDSNKIFNLKDTVVSPNPTNGENFGSNIQFRQTSPASSNNYKYYTLFVGASGHGSGTGIVYTIDYQQVIQASAIYDPSNSSDGAVTNIIVTNPGQHYSTNPPPTVYITAPTGNVRSQATASATTAIVSATVYSTIDSNGIKLYYGGSGYNLGDKLKINGGVTSGSYAILEVVDVNLDPGSTQYAVGGIKSVVVNSYGNYIAFPSGIVPTTNLTGSGSGAEFLLDTGVISVQITNPGNGYSQPPTIRFLGGGAGAEAYGLIGTAVVLSSVSGIAPGMIISGTGFVSGQKVLQTINSSSTVILSGAPDSTPSGVMNFIIPEWNHAGIGSIIAPSGIGFGASLKSCLSTLVVSAPGSYGIAGKVFVYTNIDSGYTSPSLITNNIQYFGSSIDLSSDAKWLAIGSPYDSDTYLNQGSVNVYNLSNLTTVYQRILSNKAEKNELFGIKLGWMNNNQTLAIYSAGADSVVDETFDGNSTKFDSAFTKFRITILGDGRVDIYDKYNKNYIFSESLANIADIDSSSGTPTYTGRNSAYGSGFTVGTNIVVVGAPSAIVNHVLQGRIFSYSKAPKVLSWKILHTEIAKTDLTKIKRAFIYNRVSNKVVTYLDVIDPLQGKIPGPAEQEITYKTFYDPALYSVSDVTGVNVNPGQAWGKAQVGTLWWDLRTAKFIDSHDDDIIYRTSSWATLFPGASIDIYEWVQTTYTPSQWNALADTIAGLAVNISGQSLYDNNTYCLVKKYDNISKTIKNIYYFWVKNKAVVPKLPNRTIPASGVAQLIGKPETYGYSFLALTGSNSFSLFLNDVKTTVKGTNSVLSVQYWTIDNPKTANIHRQYAIINDNPNTILPSKIEQKWFDSLCGKDQNDNDVPDISLPLKLQYGVEFKPRQSMFVNRIEALKQLIEQVNRYLITYEVVNQRDISPLNSYDTPPVYSGANNTLFVPSGLFDTVIDTDAELVFINVGNFTKPTLQPIIVNGRITGVTIVDPGFGYFQSPYIEVMGTGTGAKIKTVVTNRKITGVEVLSTGAGYDSSTSLILRNYCVLVLNDSQANNTWSICSYDTTSQTWSRIQTQRYDVRNYWSKVDWYASGYNSFTGIDYSVNTFSDLNNLTTNIGQIVKIKNTSQGGWILLEKFASANSADWTQSYKTIAVENGTIQFSSGLYNFSNTVYGFDGALYDGADFDNSASTELRIILNTIKNNILIDDLKQNYLDLFFYSVRYILSEQIEVDWIFKTSFVKAQHNVGALNQPVNYQPDNLPDFQNYIAEVKPYRTKIREYVSDYTYTDPTNSASIDFDLPPMYENGKIVPVQATVQDGQIIVDNVAIDSSDPRYYWKQNAGYKVINLVIVDGGHGYQSEPIVEFVSNSGTGAQARAFIANGSLRNIILTNTDAYGASGNGYLSAPLVVLNGGLIDGGKPARVVAIIGDSPVRSINVGIKFDRTTYGYFITQLTETETFISNGTQLQFPLKWSPNIVLGTNTVTIDGQPALRNTYTLTTVESTSKGYRSYTGLLTFLSNVTKNAVIEITYTKNWNLLNAADRIQYYYNPTSGMPGKDLAQLMTGIDYGGVAVTGIGFDVSYGWDSAPYYSDTWDNSQVSFNDYAVIVGAGNHLITLPYVPPGGTELNIYYKKWYVETHTSTGVETTFTYNIRVQTPQITATLIKPLSSSSFTNIGGSNILTLSDTNGIELNDIVAITPTSANSLLLETYVSNISGNTVTLSVNDPNTGLPTPSVLYNTQNSSNSIAFDTSYVLATATTSAGNTITLNSTPITANYVSGGAYVNGTYTLVLTNVTGTLLVGQTIIGNGYLASQNVQITSVTNTISNGIAGAIITVSGTYHSVPNVAPAQFVFSPLSIGQPVAFNSSFANIVAGTLYYILSITGNTITVSASPFTDPTQATPFVVGAPVITLSSTSSITNLITVNDTSTLRAGTTIIPTITLGGMIQGTPYYVNSVINSTTFNISVQPFSGVVFQLTDTNSQNVTINVGISSQLLRLQLTLENTANIPLGALITGIGFNGISSNTQVVAINNSTNTITLSKNITQNILSGSVVSFSYAIPLNSSATFTRTIPNVIPKFDITGKGVITLSSPLAAGTVVSIASYLNDVRLDDPNYGTNLQTNTNAVMNTVFADSINSTITIPASFTVNDGDEFIVRQSTSDGTVNLQTNDYDTAISGGDLTYGTATGLLADDIILDGDNLISTVNSSAPEEVIPGQVFDTLAIKVFEKPTTATALIRTDNYLADGSTTIFAISQTPNSKAAVIVKTILAGVQTILTSGTDFSVDYRNKQIILTNAPALHTLVSIVSIGFNGANILDIDYFVADGVRAEYVTNVTWRPNVTSIVYVDGVELPYEIFQTDNTYVSPNLIGIRFGKVPSLQSLINFVIVDGVDQTFSIVNKQNIVPDGSTTVFNLNNIVGNSLPAETNMLVRVGQNILTAPTTSYFTLSVGQTVYVLDPNRVAPNSISAQDIVVTIGTITLTPGIDYYLDISGVSVDIFESVLGKYSGKTMVISARTDAGYLYIPPTGIFAPQIKFAVPPSVGAEVEVISYYNHDILNIERSTISATALSALTPNTPAYYKLNGILGGIIPLDRSVIDENYVWVIKNGKLLTPNVDYVLYGGNQNIRLGTPSIVSDQFTIITFGGTIVSNGVAYMQFKDMLNRTVYKRLSLNKQTTLVNDLFPTDLTITVVDASNFDIPNVSSNKPGIIEIRGERIEYFTLNGNVLGQLRRGTLGTGTPAIHKAGSYVQDIGSGSTIPYIDTITTDQTVSDGTSVVNTTFVPSIIPSFNTQHNYDSVEVFVGGYDVTSEWASGANYVVGTIVTVGPYQYRCITAHTSSTNFASDSANWVFFIGNIRLKKNSYAVFNVNQAPYSPEGDVTFPADFTVDGISAQVTLTNLLTPGTGVTVIKMTGVDFDGKKTVNILNDNGAVAQFIKATPAVWYTGIQNYGYKYVLKDTFDNIFDTFDETNLTFDQGK